MTNLNKFSIPVAIVIAALLVGGVFIYINQNKLGPKIVSANEVAETAVSYINENLLTGELKASLAGVEDKGTIYKIRIKIGENEYESYVSKDGKFLFPEGIELITTSNNPASADIEKRDNPDVKLFVMSYCPYGLQMQKALLPVYDLLENRANIGVYFVNYIMHEKEEIDENLRQYCIQKEEKGKYGAYLGCFVEDGNFESCLSEAGIDRTKLSKCVSDADKEFSITAQYNDRNTWINGNFPNFPVQDDLNKQYGVQGSPTLVINDKVVEDAERVPEKIKELICSSFNSPPSECSQSLSNESPAPGFGEQADSGGNGGGCGQ